MNSIEMIEGLILQLKSVKNYKEYFNILVNVESFDKEMLDRSPYSSKALYSDDNFLSIRDHVVFLLNDKLNKIPNLKEYRLVEDYIAKGKEALSINDDVKIEEVAIKIYKTFVGKINMPENYRKWGLSTEILFPQRGEYPTKLDLESLIDNLDIYKESLISANLQKQSYKNKQGIDNFPLSIKIDNNLNAQSISSSNVDLKISIETKISQVINEVKADSSISDVEKEEINRYLEELRNIKNEHEDTRWEKCKNVLTWVGDKSVKFGKWFLPIVAEIAIGKVLNPNL